MSKTIKDSAYWDRQISTYVIFYFIASSCNMAIKNILPIPESLWGALSAMWGLAIVFFMLRSLREVLKRNSQLFYKSYQFFGFIYILSFLLVVFRGEPFHVLLRDSLFLNFAWWIPVGVYACSVYDKRILIDTMYKGSFVISVVLLAYFYMGRVSMTLEDSNMYSMTFGFAFILPIILHVSRLYTKFSYWLLAFVLIEVFTLFVFANRGVILSLIFYFAYKTFAVSRNNAKSFIVVLLMVIVGLFVLIASDNLLGSVNSFLDANNMQSRSLTMMANDTFSDDSGRSDIWGICFNMIVEKPVLGWGLGGEYYQLAKEISGSTAYVSASAFTPHNAFIQAFVNFGIIGGFVVTILFLTPIFNLHNIKDDATKEAVLIVAAAALIPCLISSDGLFYKPELAIYLYVYYHYRKRKTTIHRVRYAYEKNN